MFSGLNFIGVIAAAIAGFAFGAIYYSALSKSWVDATGRTEAELRGEGGKMRTTPFLVAALAQLLIAYFMAGLLLHMEAFSIRGGLITGFFVWLGFVITTLSVNYAFQNMKPKLIAIDGAHWLGVCLIIGAVLGATGV
jgi:hypothetical protein